MLYLHAHGLFIGIRVVKIVHGPLVHDIVRNVTPVDPGIRHIAVRPLLFRILSGFPADVAETLGQGLLGREHISGQGRVAGTQLGEMGGHAVFHILPSDALDLLPDALNGCGGHIILAHGLRYLRRRDRSRRGRLGRRGTWFGARRGSGCVFRPCFRWDLFLRLVRLCIFPPPLARFLSGRIFDICKKPICPYLLCEVIVGMRFDPTLSAPHSRRGNRRRQQEV